MTTTRIKQKTEGFALLLAVLVGTVVLAIGLSILNVTLKQIIISNFGAESERAFHAAYAGVECAQYFNLLDRWDNNAPDNAWIRCVGQGGVDSGVDVFPHNDGEKEKREMEYSWDDNDIPPELQMAACTKMTVYKYFDTNKDVSIGILPSTLSSQVRTCEKGTECTVVVSRGYNRNCTDVDTNPNLRTVERVVTVRF